MALVKIARGDAKPDQHLIDKPCSRASAMTQARQVNKLHNIPDSRSSKSSLLRAMSVQDNGFRSALAEAQQGMAEGGVPIGACLVSRDGKVLGCGHNLRVQNGSATLHVTLHHTLYRHPIDHLFPG